MIRLKLWLGAVAAAIAAVWGILLAGRRQGAQKARTDALRADAATQERMNEADTHSPNDDAARKWLHDFAERNRR